MKKMSRTIFILPFILGSMAAGVSAREINNVAFPETVTVNERPLSLNGGGLRTATILNVKVYVAAFYSPKPLTTDNEVYGSPGPLRIDLHYVRAVGQAKVTEAWNWQFNASVVGDYPNYPIDRDAFVKLFGPIAKDEVITIETAGDDTLVYEDGKLKGAVSGKDFQRAFWSMWFGKKPVTPELKKQLLGGK